MACAGKKAIMTVFDDGVEREQVQLYQLKTKEQMHAKFLELGFKRKSDSEITQSRVMALTDKVLAQEASLSTVYSTMFKVNGIIVVVGVIFFFFINARRRKTKRGVLPQ